MLAVLLAQFCSAFADNALLITAIAVLKAAGQADRIPLLQGAFVLPFIFLAPFVGAIADAFPKGRVMLVSNAIKLAAALLMFTGFPPLLGYGLAGLGAAAYSPAKYGILSQLVGAEKLVKANGLLEGSTIVAILLGVLAGGWLADHGIAGAYAGVIGIYALAAAINLLIPRLAVEHALDAGAFARLGREFLTAVAGLWRDTDARFSLLGTSVFWGTGSTLRLLLFAWVPVALGMADNQTPARLMGAVSVGIVLGAGLAGATVRLERVNRALVGGLLLGPLVMLFAHQSQLTPTALALAAIGAAGGYFVVPLNALLQERGHLGIGAGRALAVQNFWENLAMLGFVGTYAMLEGVPVVSLATGLGATLVAGLAALAWSRRGRR
jgi:LPLT family lysophospholipid transporter-like MFS transporter